MDDCESSKRQHCELECENGGARDWCEARVHGWKWIRGGDFGTELNTDGS